MPLVINGNPLNGTAGDDQIIDRDINPNNTLNGFGGNDLLLADRNTFFTAYGMSTVQAIDLTGPYWCTLENDEIENSTTVPHASALFVASAATQAYYYVNGYAGRTITLDVDFSTGSTDTVVDILAADGTLLASNDDSATNAGGFGSTSTRDSFLQYTFEANSRYYIRVRESGGDELFEAGDRFVLNVSLTDQLASNERPHGNDTLNGGTGTDTMSGGGGDDTLLVAYGDLTAGEYYAGGSGSDRLVGSGNSFYYLDFTTSTVLSIETIEYTALEEGGTAIFRFAGSQIGGAGLAYNTLLDFSGADDVTDAFLVEMLDSTNISLGLFTFANAGVGDYVSITGDSDNESIFGSTFRDIIDGNGGADTLTGGQGLDTVRGGAGNDVLAVYAGDTVAGEAYDGGADQDTLAGANTLGTYDLDFTASTVLSIEAVRFETPGAAGTSTMRFAASQIGSGIASNASVTFNGFFGSSEVFEIQMLGSTSVDLSRMTFVSVGGSNFVSVVGHDAAETMIGSAIRDVLEGGGGNDSLYGGLGPDVLSGSGGTDLVFYDDADYGNLVIRLDTPSANTGAAAGDTYFGIEGIVAGAGNDTVGGDGADNLLYGRGGNDVLRGNGGADTMDGGTGSDHLFGGAGADRHVGGDGLDYARYDDADYGNLVINLSNAGLNTGAAAGDTFSGIECIVSGAGNDTVVGDAYANRLFGGGGNDIVRAGVGADYVEGGDGNDHLYGGAGADSIVGGAGLDYARYDEANYGNLTIRLDAPSANTGAAAGDTYSGIECIVAGSGNDTVFGDGGVNRLFGMGGNDTIDGRAGSDYLEGGAGADNYRFSTALGASNVDTIAGFQHGVDNVMLHSSIFAGIGPTLTASEFGSTPGAGRFIVYLKNTGQLFYDEGGAGIGAGPRHFATVTPGTTLDVNDFVMV